MSKILGVECNHGMSKPLISLLTANSHTISLCNSSDKIALTTNENRPDLVLLDLTLVNEDAFTLCQKIRLFSDVPIIVLATSATNSDRLRIFSLGADDCISKPYSQQELLLRINKTIKRSNQYQADISLFKGAY